MMSTWLLLLPCHSPQWFKTWRSSRGVCLCSPWSNLTSTSWQPNCERGRQVDTAGRHGGRPCSFSHLTTSPPPATRKTFIWRSLHMCVFVCVDACWMRGCARVAGRSHSKRKQKNHKVVDVAVIIIEVTPESPHVTSLIGDVSSRFTALCRLL